MKNSNYHYYLPLIFFFCLTACTSNEQLNEFAVYEYAVYKNAPIFEDEYLFPKELKNCLKVKDKNLEWFLVDWNNNGLYDEFGIDYLGLQSKLDEKPLLTILKERNYIKVSNDSN